MIVDNGNSNSNIKYTIINTKIPIKANSVLFTSERLYTIWRSCALVFTLSIISWRFARNRRAKYLLLNSVFPVIKKLTTGVDNENRKSNIKS